MKLTGLVALGCCVVALLMAPSTVSAHAPVAATDGGGDDDGPSTGLVIAALALGALGVAVGTAGLLASRRKAA